MVELTVYTGNGPRTYYLHGMTQARILAEGLFYQSFLRKPDADIEHYTGHFRFQEHTIQ